MNNGGRMNYQEVVKKLEKDGWRIDLKRGTHVRMRKEVQGQTMKLMIPAHRSIKRSTRAYIFE